MEEPAFVVGASAPPDRRFSTFLRWVVQQDAPQLFARLLQSPVKIERLYGLLGLWLTDPKEFDKAAPKFKSDREVLTEWNADTKERRTVSEIATDIGKAKYDFDIRNRLQKPLTIFARYKK
jgi:hypothetical protein